VGIGSSNRRLLPPVADESRLSGVIARQSLAERVSLRSRQGKVYGVLFYLVNTLGLEPEHTAGLFYYIKAAYVRKHYIQYQKVKFVRIKRYDRFCTAVTLNATMPDEGKVSVYEFADSFVVFCN
jgi:hypothetical protein